MPCRYLIDKERRLVISRGWDRVTFDEMKAHETQLKSDPDFNPEYNQLLDATKVTVLELSIDEAKTMAGRTIFAPGSRRAWVATDPAIYGMGRLMATYHEMGKMPTQVCVFYDLRCALEWLGLEALPDAIKPEEAKKVKAATPAKNNKIA